MPYPQNRKTTGPRPTAGRPRRVSTPARLTVTIEDSQLEWLARQGDKSATIRRLIAAAMESE